MFGYWAMGRPRMATHAHDDHDDGDDDGDDGPVDEEFGHGAYLFSDTAAFSHVSSNSAFHLPPSTFS